MNPETTSYLGVQFTPDQKLILVKDLELIDKYEAELVNLQAQRGQAQANIDQAQNNINACGSNTACTSQYGVEKDYWIVVRDKFDTFDIPTKFAQISAAKKNYNDDLVAIQNQVKFALQAAQANNQTSAQNSQNAVNLLQNDPRVLLLKAEAENEQKLKALELQATLDKQQKEQNVKIVIFVLVGTALVVGTILFLRRIL